ncbi:MAG: hypothetical protein JNM63_02170, partial [Spirochaetia bacterium]|nr:hypothetical protein [Spirochaetia bacterium]
MTLLGRQSLLFHDLSPIDFYFSDDKGLVDPHRITNEMFQKVAGHIEEAEREVFHFALGELVSNCYFSELEKYFRVHYAGKSPEGGKDAILKEMYETHYRSNPARESLRVEVYDRDKELHLLILSDVFPEQESLDRIQERLAWTFLSANRFISQVDDTGREYFSMTGSAGFGIYMARKEIQTYGGTLAFVLGFEE